jgi:hypothetical protein
MSEAEILELKKELKDSQEKFCDQRHKTIDETLEKLENSVQKILWWLIGTMGTIMVTLLVTIFKK